MFWEEEHDEAPQRVPDDVVDLSFSIRCKVLPVDHAKVLADAVHQVLPWFREQQGAALHLIHVAESGNGWERPQHGDELLYLSRRTRFVLRVPKQRIDDARALTGRTLDVGGYEIAVGEAEVKLLSIHPTQYSRYVLARDEQESEQEFLGRIVDELRGNGIRFKKILCGKITRFGGPEGELVTRSVMVADLEPLDAVRLQEIGLGDMQSFGLGLFVPHKSLKKVSS